MEAAFDKQFMEGLAKVEQVYQICGRKMGDEALSKYVGDYFIENNATLKAFRLDMEKYDKPQLQGSPASSHNLCREDKPGVNYFAPMKVLTRTCQNVSLTQVCTKRSVYTAEWLEQCIAELMRSEHRDNIAEAWDEEGKRLRIRGYVLGALRTAGVFNCSALHMARLYFDTEENTAEVKTLAKYIGDVRHCKFADWIIEYVDNH